MPKKGERRPLMERVLAKVELDPGSGCWVWQGGHNGKNREKPDRARPYGVVGVWVADRPDRMHTVLVHRAVYEHYYGPITAGLEIDHVKDRGCSHTLCCNPDHLEAVTRSENIDRSDCPGMVNARKTHCIRGHPLEGPGADVYRTPKGYRTCRRCMRVHQARHDAKRRRFSIDVQD